MSCHTESLRKYPHIDAICCALPFHGSPKHQGPDTKHSQSCILAMVTLDENKTRNPTCLPGVMRYLTTCGVGTTLHTLKHMDMWYATTDGRVYRVCNNSTTMQQFNTHVYHPDWFPFIRRNFKQAYQRGERHTDRDMDTENEREEVHARGVSGLGAAGSTRKRRILRRE